MAKQKGVACVAAFALALFLGGCGTGGDTSPVARPALAPPADIRLSPLFPEPAPRGEQRFRRLEGAVQELRNDVDAAAPALGRIAAMEKDMKDLSAQVQALSAAAQPVTAPASNPAPAVAVTTTTISAIRIGDHPGKTRVVLDTDTKIPFKAALQGERRKLVIDLGGAAWQAKPSWIANSGNLVSGYRHENGVLTIDLISPGKILSQQVIEGENGKGYRIVVEVAGESVF